MLRVRTSVKTSDTHGIGLFAAQFIPKGTITWQRDPSLDIEFTEKDVSFLEKETREKFLWHCYYDHSINKFIMCADDQRFINHSSNTPNIQSTPDKDIAMRDINEGEELLCNYRDYEEDWFERRGYKEEDFN